MIACVASCHMHACDVMVMSCLLTVAPGNRMECYELRMPLVVRSRRVVQSVTMWWPKELLCTTKYYASTTL